MVEDRRRGDAGTVDKEEKGSGDMVEETKVEWGGSTSM
jgi:hypothetical protein